MATRAEILAEARRRGLLSEEKQGAYDEAVRRGIIPADKESEAPVIQPVAPDSEAEPAPRGPAMRTLLAALDPAGIGRGAARATAALNSPEVRANAGEAARSLPPATAAAFAPGAIPIDPRLTREQVEEGGVATGAAVKRIVDNAGNIVPAAGNLLADAAAIADTAAGTAGRALEGDPLDIGERFSASREEQRGKFPASALIDGPAVDSRDVRAAIAAGPEALQGLFRGEGANVGERFDAARERFLEGDIASREENPGANLVGDVAGDIATVVSGRAPIARAARNKRLAAAAEPARELAPGLLKELDRAYNSGIARKLRQGGLRVREAGIEGAVIAALNDDDPLTAAAYSGGAQAAGTTVLNMAELGLGKRGKNLAVALAGATAMIQMFKSATPGGRDRILESTETAANKITGLMALGILSAGAGFGRVQEGMADSLPIIADGVSAIPRGAVVSLLSDLSNDTAGNSQLIETVIFKLADDPEYFGPTAARRLERAIMSEKLSVGEEVARLSKDRKFRQRITALRNQDNQQGTQ